MEKYTAKRPYLFKAYLDWILDNDLTPHILVNTNYPATIVPVNYIADNRIVLNIAPVAIGKFEMNNFGLIFSGRFNGQIENIEIPWGALIAIYARENADGIQFEPELVYQEESMVGAIKQLIKDSDSDNNKVNKKKYLQKIK